MSDHQLCAIALAVVVVLVIIVILVLVTPRDPARQEQELEPESIEDQARRTRLQLQLELLEQQGAEPLRRLALLVAIGWTDPAVGDEQWQQLVGDLADYLVRTQ